MLRVQVSRVYCQVVRHVAIAQSASLFLSLTDMGWLFLV